MTTSRAPLRPTLFAALLLAGLVITGCTPDTAPESHTSGEAETTVTAADILAEHGMSDWDARTVVDRLEATPLEERQSELIVSVRPDALAIADASGREASLALPADQFYLSMAPYLDDTHECFFHSLTTCRGELAHTALEIRIVQADGTVLIDDTRETNDNGFLGVWLPRDIDAVLTIGHGEHRLEVPIGTSAEDPTCLTELPLA